MPSIHVVMPKYRSEDFSRLEPETWEIRDDNGNSLGTVTDQKTALDLDVFFMYQKLCERTESKIPNLTEDMECENIYDTRILHGVFGLVTEAGEMMDMLKKHMFYKKDFDKINLLEETGDILWYVSVLLNALGSSYPEVMRANYNKLKKRYRDGRFNKEDAITRDVAAERAGLERDHGGEAAVHPQTSKSGSGN